MSTAEQSEWIDLLKTFKKELKKTVEWNDSDLIDEYKIISDIQDCDDNATPTRTVQLQNSIHDCKGSTHRQLYARFQSMESMGTFIDIIQHHTEFPDHYKDTGSTEIATKTRTQHIHLDIDTFFMLMIAWIDWGEKREEEG